MSSVRPTGVVLSALLLAGAPGADPPPQRLAIYYGYPSLVNGAQGDIERALAHFSGYDVLVFGDGLEFDAPVSGYAGPAEHAFTRLLIRRLGDTARRPNVFGYVDLGRTNWLSIPDLIDRIERWGAMGADGIFLDEAGYDFGVTRGRQNAAVSAAHARGLRVCLNAFNPADLFDDVPTPLNSVGGGNPEGLAPGLSTRDAVLLESFAVREGELEPLDSLEARMRVAAAGRRRFGTQVFAVATAGARAADLNLAQYGFHMAAKYDVDAYAWGVPGYSAVTSQLPWMPRPDAR
jgi:hypothetical protein